MRRILMRRWCEFRLARGDGWSGSELYSRQRQMTSVFRGIRSESANVGYFDGAVILITTSADHQWCASSYLFGNKFPTFLSGGSATFTGRTKPERQILIATIMLTDFTPVCSDSDNSAWQRQSSSLLGRICCDQFKKIMGTSAKFFYVKLIFTDIQM